MTMVFFKNEVDRTGINYIYMTSSRLGFNGYQFTINHLRPWFE